VTLLLVSSSRTCECPTEFTLRATPAPQGAGLPLRAPEAVATRKSQARGGTCPTEGCHTRAQASSLRMRLQGVVLDDTGKPSAAILDDAPLGFVVDEVGGGVMAGLTSPVAQALGHVPVIEQGKGSMPLSRRASTRRSWKSRPAGFTAPVPCGMTRDHATDN
jgi:hypothetical protein